MPTSGSKPPRVYFARAVDGLDRDRVIDLAQGVRKELDVVGLTTIDPVAASEPMIGGVRDESEHSGDAPRNYRQVVEQELAILRSCDAVLMDMSIPSRNYIGCVCEMTYAHMWNIPCVVYLDAVELNRPWLKYHATATFGTRIEAIAFLADYFYPRIS